MKSRSGRDPVPPRENFRFHPATTTRLLVKRDGRSLLRSASIPKPVVLVDTREQQPLPLFANHRNWIGGERRVALKTGDYSVEGMEGLVALERKSLADLVNCTNISRDRFIAGCSRLARFRWKAILIEASYEDIKRGWDTDEIQSDVHPNSVCGLLDAIEASFGIPVLLTSRHRELATERAASWLSKHFTYWWLEQNGYSRILIDTDRL
jgi:ERCC4-type nuclease